MVTIQASNGKELITKLESAQEFPDVILLDISMPVMNGLETQVELMKKWPQSKTLVVTVHEMEIYIKRMIRAGAKGYLAKDCSPNELIDAIQSIHTHGIYFSNISKIHFLNAAQAKFPQITQAEMDVLKEIGSDLSYEDIAEKLGKSKRSVEGHRDSLFKKLDVKTRANLLLVGIRLGLLPQEQYISILNDPKP